MGDYEKLNLANNLDALDLLAKRSHVLTEFRKMKFNGTCSMLDKLYKEAQQQPLNQERKYILLTRYLLLYDQVLDLQTDKKFVEVRFGAEYKRARMQFEEVKKSLVNRYAKSAVKQQSEKPPEGTSDVPSKLIVPSEPLPIFDKQFIKCIQLYSALQKNLNILLIDARPSQDFKESRIDVVNIINVPEQCITSGLSANALGKKLPPEVQLIWEKRDSYDVLVLLDWNTTAENFVSTKLDKLHSALTQWDLNRNYKENPVILNGGYIDFLEMYPTMCNNPQIYLSRRNYELDELLDIDNIIYPLETDSKAHVMGSSVDIDNALKIETVPSEGGETRDSLVKENKKLALNVQDILSKLLTEETAWKEVNEECIKETNISTLRDLKDKETAIQEKIQSLKEQLDDYEEKKNKVRQQFDLYAKFDPESETLQSDEITEIIKIEKADTEKMKIIDAISKQRCKVLEQARALKPKSRGATFGSELKESKIPEVLPEKPVVDRATKPDLMRRNEDLFHRIEIDTTSQQPGKVGLKNINNTCYMNTIIQCFKTIPWIARLFCDGSYANLVTRTPAAIIYETAFLIRYLWSKTVAYMIPMQFYEKVSILEPQYKRGSHEDCSEFFLFLLNHLSEDCSYDISRPHIMTPMQKAWYNQFQGKNSIFIDLFFHQIRIQQSCSGCSQTTFKFEIESTFMLPVPDTDFTLNSCLSQYLADFIIPEYCCSKCKKPVINTKFICHEPKVMVITLKRYKIKIENGTNTFSKIESKCSFPRTNFKLGECLYDLKAIALHSGNMSFGHYTAVCLTNSGWMEFNDETVRPININDESVKVKAMTFFYTRCEEMEISKQKM